MEDIEADIRQLREDVARLTEHLKETGTRTMNRARKAASEGAEDLHSDLVEVVREKPLTTLALAAGVGFFFALITRR